MKKIFLIIFLLAVVLPLCLAEETITMRTYFPSSSASYDTLTLSPTNTSPGSSTEGELYYDRGGVNQEGLYYFDGSAWKLVGAGVGGLWTASGSDIYYTGGNVSIGTDAAAEFTLNIGKGVSPFEDGGIIAKGTFGSGADLTTSGAGTRFIWYPKKAAFRAGYVSGSQWDDSNIGNYSVATGQNTIANGTCAVAFGYRTKAQGLYSTTFGYNTTAIGEASTAMGRNTIASGEASTAMGDNTIASGTASFASGYYTVASGLASTAMGQNTIASGEASTAIGDGTASGRYSTVIGHGIASGEASLALGGGGEDGWVQTAGNYSIALGSYVSTAAGADYAIVIGRGYDSDNFLENNIASSLMVGFISTVPTLFVGPGSGVGTIGRVGIGTTDPKSILHIAGDGTISLAPRANDPLPTGGIWKLYVYVNGSTRELRIRGPKGTINTVAVLTP